MTSFLRRFAVLAVFAAVLAVLPACDRSPDEPGLPTGPQILTGTLLPTEISLSRRGTHLFRLQNSLDAYYAESAEVNLRSMEGKEIVLEGTFSPNIDPDALPLYRVTRVVEVLEQETKEWRISSLGLSLDAPETWQVVTLDSKAELSVPGGEDVLVTITSEGEEPLLQSPVPIVIDAQRAQRSMNEQTGEQRVVLTRDDDSYLLLVFRPGTGADAERLREQWLSLLRSITLLSTGSSPQPSTGTGATAGGPCGGPAGVLCPAGYYCQIQNIQENIGICQPL